MVNANLLSVLNTIDARMHKNLHKYSQVVKNGAALKKLSGRSCKFKGGGHETATVMSML